MSSSALKGVYRQNEYKFKADVPTAYPVQVRLESKGHYEQMFEWGMFIC